MAVNFLAFQKNSSRCQCQYFWESCYQYLVWIFINVVPCNKRTQGLSKYLTFATSHFRQWRCLQFPSAYCSDCHYTRGSPQLRILGELTTLQFLLFLHISGGNLNPNLNKVNIKACFHGKLLIKDNFWNRSLLNDGGGSGKLYFTKLQNILI